MDLYLSQNEKFLTPIILHDSSNYYNDSTIYVDPILLYENDVWKSILQSYPYTFKYDSNLYSLDTIKLMLDVIHCITLDKEDFYMVSIPLRKSTLLDIATLLAKYSTIYIYRTWCNRYGLDTNLVRHKC